MLISLPAKLSAEFLGDLESLHRKKISESKDKGSEPNPPTPPNIDLSNPPPVPVPELPILHIDIEYRVLDPNAGAIFYGSRSDEKSHVREPMYMLTDSQYGMARFWMPCVDSPDWCDRYMFDFDISVDPSLVVVASGELDDTALIPNQSSNQTATNQKDFTKMYKYRGDIPAHASEIVVAIGPFVAIPDPVLSNTVTHFCLPGRAHELVFTGPLFTKVYAFCKDYFGSDPPTSSVKQLFLGSNGRNGDSSIAGAGGVIVHSGDLLHTERCIDEAFIAREAIMKVVVRIYLGRFLRPRTSEDGWLIAGLAAHISALGLQAILGRNWYKFYIYNLMEELRKERSCDLSHADVERLTDSMLDPVRRRSHVILYMIERRIGGDVMKRALRDIIAEGKKAVNSLIKVIDKTVSKPILLDNVGDSIHRARRLPTHRELKDLHRDPALPKPSTVTVASGSDEATQGVGVGPFLKRLRAICGTDVRSMVRLWASSPGIPRMQVGYQYNPRKHTIELVVKQEPPTDIKYGRIPSRPVLQFHGTMSIRVMEADGACPHSLEITDLICTSDIPCHSRRKAGKAGGSEESNPNAVTQASPLSWIRFDPENEWCVEMSFKQHESSWAAVLDGDRDCIGQLEACRGLKNYTSEQSGRRLLSVVNDSQAYWQVRAEATYILASTQDGLKMLINYFKQCYADCDEEGTAHLRPNNFSNIANYYVKRAMLRAFASARVKGTCTAARPDGSIPVEASQFLCFILAGHDNGGNEYDDDFYIVELFKNVTDVAVLCVGDPLHAGAGEGGSSTTETITRHLERFQSLERMIRRRTMLVASALATSLCRIERALMIYRDKEEMGAVSTALRQRRYTMKKTVLNALLSACQRKNSLDDRLLSISCLVETYGANLDILLWALSHVDRTSNGDDLTELAFPSEKLDDVEVIELDGGNGVLTAPEHRSNANQVNGSPSSGGGKGKGSQAATTLYAYCETPRFRYRLLDLLCDVTSRKEWYGKSSLVVQGIRSHSKPTVEFCIRLHRLIVMDSDPRVRSSALRLAKNVWGIGVPLCLMSRLEYQQSRASLERDRTKQANSNSTITGGFNVLGFGQGKKDKHNKHSKVTSDAQGLDIVEMKSHSGIGVGELKLGSNRTFDDDTLSTNSSKSKSKSKGVKNGKSKHGKKERFTGVELPPKPPKFPNPSITSGLGHNSNNMPSSKPQIIELTDAMDVPVLSLEPKVKDKDKDRQRNSRPLTVPIPPTIPSSMAPPDTNSLPVLSPVPKYEPSSKPKSKSKQKLKAMQVSAHKPPLQPSSFSPPPRSSSLPSPHLRPPHSAPLSPPVNRNPLQSHPAPEPASQPLLPPRATSPPPPPPPPPPHVTSRLSSKLSLPWSNNNKPSMSSPPLPKLSMSASVGAMGKNRQYDGNSKSSRGGTSRNPSVPGGGNSLFGSLGKQPLGKWSKVDAVSSEPGPSSQDFDHRVVNPDKDCTINSPGKRDNYSSSHAKSKKSAAHGPPPNNSTTGAPNKPGLFSIPRSVAVGSTNSIPTDGQTNKRSSNSTVGRSIPRSVPASQPSNKRGLDVSRFRWHPLDAEDSNYLMRAWDERDRDSGRDRQAKDMMARRERDINTSERSGSSGRAAVGGGERARSTSAGSSSRGRNSGSSGGGGNYKPGGGLGIHLKSIPAPQQQPIPHSRPTLHHHYSPPNHHHHHNSTNNMDKYSSRERDDNGRHSANSYHHHHPPPPNNNDYGRDGRWGRDDDVAAISSGDSTMRHRAYSSHHNNSQDDDYRERHDDVAMARNELPVSGVDHHHRHRDGGGGVREGNDEVVRDHRDDEDDRDGTNVDADDGGSGEHKKKKKKKKRKREGGDADGDEHRKKKKKKKKKKHKSSSEKDYDGGGDDGTSSRAGVDVDDGDINHSNNNGRSPSRSDYGGDGDESKMKVGKIQLRLPSVPQM